VAPATETSEPWANGAAATPPSERPADTDIPLATAADFRSVRRWALIAAVAALVATAVAIAALVGSPAAPDDGERDQGTEATQIRQALDGRLDAGMESLRSDLDERATTADLRALEQRVRELRRRTSRASERASTRASETSSELDDMTTKLDDVEQRIQTLELAPPPQPEAQAGDGGVVAP
jgi:hypothetical protein